MGTPGEQSRCHVKMNSEPGEEIVISGISGRFPDSRNMKIFAENLRNKKDMITTSHNRWQTDCPDIPQRMGKIEGVEKFDRLFFGVHPKQANIMDPMGRMILEHAYEAIADSGFNPRQLAGSKTGVFVGVCFSDSEKNLFNQNFQENVFAVTGTSRGMLANRVSFALDFNGPSYAVDSGCSSSLLALEHAYRSLKSGECEAAIVASSNLCLHPNVTLQYFHFGVLSADGYCRPFDEKGNGYVRAEAIVAVFLQKAKDARRIYANLLSGKVNSDGYKEQGITFPSTDMQFQLLRDFYAQCKVPPTMVSYVEAHGTATEVGDPQEVNSIDKFFSPGRTTPLMIGSVKSNMGHGEPASGLCSIAKVVTAMESGILPPTLHFERPRKGLTALEEGRLQVVTECTPWNGGYIGINSFGFGGANVHILLKSHDKEKKNGGAPEDDLPRLVAVSGRTEEAVLTLLNDVASRPVDVEHVRLLQDIHSTDIRGHSYRGYVVLPSHGLSENPVKEIDQCLQTKRPIWFMFSGMGSQWPGMGKSLLRFPVFAEAIKKCDAALRPKGVDIYHILTTKDERIFNNILNSFVGIAAVQIGLVDILKHVGIVPARLIGHSFGELGCAYADECFTAEQMILSAYYRGVVSIQTEFMHGAMAVIGLGQEKLRPMCPPGIEISCHNSAYSSNISGPAESVKSFVAKLQAENIFAKEMEVSNIAYHSRYVAEGGPKLLKLLKGVIPSPKTRSAKWLSTSVPHDQWSAPMARQSSAEYHTNNFVSPVLFEEVLSLVPRDAVVIEIAPHGLFTGILKKALEKSVAKVALAQREHQENVEFLTQALGKLYNLGVNSKVENLYPEVQYPVSRGTPMISPCIRWDHSEDFFVMSQKVEEMSGERTLNISLRNEQYEYMDGHVVQGTNLLPGAGFLFLVWQSFGSMRGRLHFNMSVVFEDVRFVQVVTLRKDDTVKLTLMVQKGSGRFEITEKGSVIITGYIRAVEKPAEERVDPSNLKIDDDDDFCMSSEDIYKEFRLRGYEYNELFRSLKRATITGTKGIISWENNWVTFMDCMFQLGLFQMDTRSLYVPTGIRKLVIDTEAHQKAIQEMTDEKVITAYVDTDLKIIIAGGIEVRGMSGISLPRRKEPREPTLEEYKFVPHVDEAETSLQDVFRLAVQLAAENHPDHRVKIVEVVNESPEALVSPFLPSILEDIPMLQPELFVLAPPETFQEGEIPENVSLIDFRKLVTDVKAFLVIGQDLLQRQDEDLNLLLSSMANTGFLITRESSGSQDTSSRIRQLGLDVVLRKRSGGELILLLRRRFNSLKRPVVVFVRNDELSWLPELQQVLRDSEEEDDEGRILLVGQSDSENGLMGLLKCLREEPGGGKVKGVLIYDQEAPVFSLDHPLYADQLQLDLVANVLMPGRVWGTYRYTTLPTAEPRLVHHARVFQLAQGDLRSLRWQEGPLKSSGDNVVREVYASINFRDVMVATGKIGVSYITIYDRFKDDLLGCDYAGIDSSGKRVMGMQHWSFSNLCVKDKFFIWDVPEEWSLEDAVTVPSVYGTMYLALYLKARIKKGDKVLIHAGTGGVGQAAINAAIFEGCEVFTTVGTPEKREFLRKHFPQIPESHIGSTRDTSFEQMVLHLTKGEGVDVVLNSLTEEKLQASLRCLKRGGIFLEIGKYDMILNSPLGMEVFLKHVSFHGVLLDTTNKLWEKEAVKELLKKGIKDGVVKPLPRVVFPKTEVEAALRYMATAKHIGKVILRIREEGESIDDPILAYPRYNCIQDRSYIIHGGLGGMGLELADFLVLRGARNLVLTSRRGLKEGYQRFRVDLWRSYGVRVDIVVGKDASNLQDCRSILEAATHLGAVDGIFNLALVLRDDLLKNLSVEAFQDLLDVKAGSTKRFDVLSREMCPHLRHFVVFSSMASGRGNQGQTNYGMANSIMERICERRKYDGLPALAIQWGPISDVGQVYRMSQGRRDAVHCGTLMQTLRSCFQTLDGFLMQEKTVVSSLIVFRKRTAPQITDIVTTVLDILGLQSLKNVNHQTYFTEMGMDSIMANEIKHILDREFQVALTVQEVKYLNIESLYKIQEKAMGMESKVSPKPEDAKKNKLEELDRGGHFVSNEEESIDSTFHG
ncbi:fatty acid synthase [Orussus abietinus]|uniref:fatty acid synthase n=1 Tax=Orussus abietinus TaxID=222816 RepID=UPI000625A8BD|nr:fatty acid synthase [Orussus abietinus]XP_012280383.1 fatty acid synthase [Orussus abietinus]